MSTSKQPMTWHSGIDEWCRGHYGSQRLEVSRRAPFAPFEAHHRERFFQVPVVLAVLPSTTSHLHAGFAGAIDLMRISSAAYRVVAVTDMYCTPAMRACDWPIEQMLSEDLWLAQGAMNNWLEHATDQVGQAQRYFGASHVVAPGDREDSLEAIRMLAHAYGIEHSILAAAAKMFDTSTEPAGAEHGTRGGWHDIQAGADRERRFRFSGGIQIDAMLHRGDRPGVLLSTSSDPAEAVADSARNHGLSTAVMSAGAGAGPSHRHAVARSIIDALGGRGPVIVTSKAHDWIGSGHAPEVTDGVLEAGAADDWKLNLAAGGSVRFATGRAGRVFEALRHVRTRA